MSTQAIPGYSGRVYVSDDGGSNYVEVGELRDVELSPEWHERLSRRTRVEETAEVLRSTLRESTR